MGGGGGGEGLKELTRQCYFVDTMDSKFTLSQQYHFWGKKIRKQPNKPTEVHYQEAPLQNQTPFNDQPKYSQINSRCLKAVWTTPFVKKKRKASRF